MTEGHSQPPSPEESLFNLPPICHCWALTVSPHPMVAVTLWDSGPLEAVGKLPRCVRLHPCHPGTGAPCLCNGQTSPPDAWLAWLGTHTILGSIMPPELSIEGHTSVPWVQKEHPVWR